MNPEYTRYHPKWWRDRMPIFWWVRHLAYTRFITRELTSVFVAYAALLLLVHARALAVGGAAYERLLDWLRNPAVLAFHAVVLLALLFHSVTWLSLAPKALVVRVGGRRVPPPLVAAAHYAAWAATSALLAWGLLGGLP